MWEERLEHGSAGSLQFPPPHSPSNQGPLPASSPSACANLNSPHHPQTSQVSNSARQMAPPSSHLPRPEALSHACSSLPLTSQCQRTQPCQVFPLSAAWIHFSFSLFISTTSSEAKPPICPSRTSAVAPSWCPLFPQTPMLPIRPPLSSISQL